MSIANTNENQNQNQDLAAAAIAARAQRQSRTRLGRHLPQVLGRSHQSRTTLAMLAAEAGSIGPDRDTGTPTHGETLAHWSAKASADDGLARSQRQMDKRAEEIEQQQARRAELNIAARHQGAVRVRHPDGGLRSVNEVVTDEKAQRAQIEAERARGSRQHQRLPRWMGRLPLVVLVADSCLLAYFFSGITDVNWAAPLSADLAFALLLTAVVTTAAYGFLAFTGSRLRSFKDHSGTIPREDLDGLTKVAAAGAIVVIAVLSVLMFTRMRTEVLYALGHGSGGTALLIALTLAVVSALANFLVLAVHARDGSDSTARLDALSATTRRPLARARALREEADIIPGRIARLRRRAVRQAARAITTADRQMAAASKNIYAARAQHQAAGPNPGGAGQPDPAALRPDLRHLTTSLQHINSELLDPGQPEQP